MTPKYIFIIVLFSSVIYCQKISDFYNTKWVGVKPDDVIGDYFKFMKDNTFAEYADATETTHYGNYFMKKDTLVLCRFKPKGNDKRIGAQKDYDSTITKFVLRKNKLVEISFRAKYFDKWINFEPTKAFYSKEKINIKKRN